MLTSLEKRCNKKAQLEKAVPKAKPINMVGNL